MAGQCPIDKLETILLATDGSSFSDGAVREAIRLGAKCSSRLVAMSAVEFNEEFASEAPMILENEEVRAGKFLAAVKDQAAAAGVECETTVRTGEAPWRLVVEEAQNLSAEMIVMGRRGRTGLARVTMGSVTARVIGHAPCDVLVVPRDASLEFGTIMAATDGSPFGEAAVREALKLAAKCGSSLVIISVAGSDSSIKEAEQNVAMAAAMAAEAGMAAETVTASGKAYRQIVAAADERHADLIVTGCHGRSGLSQLLMGSVTDRVIGHAGCAVLVACSGKA